MIALRFSTALVTASQRSAWVLAFDRQVKEHFGPAWSSIPPTIVDYANVVPSPGLPIIDVRDAISVAGALGDHSEDASGNVIGEVGAQTCLNYGASISQTISHEILEAARDPWVNGWFDDPVSGASWAFEMCDAVQDGLYTIDGVDVSNFLLPAFFNPRGTGGPWDHMGALSKPFSMTKGGYSVIRFGGPGTETQVGLRAMHRSKVFGRTTQRLPRRKSL